MAQTVNPVPASYSLQMEELERIAEGYTILRKYIVPVAQEATFLADFPINFADATYTASVCTRRRKEPFGGEGDQLFLYTLSYEPYRTAAKNGRPPVLASSPSSSDPVNDIYEWEGVQEDVPISALGGTVAADNPGVETYIVGGAVWKKTVFVDVSWSPAESDLTADVGKLQAPDGLSGTTAANWLRLPNQVRLQGSHFEYTESWRFAPNGWGTDIYETA